MKTDEKWTYHWFKDTCLTCAALKRVLKEIQMEDEGVIVVREEREEL